MCERSHHPRLIVVSSTSNALRVFVASTLYVCKRATSILFCLIKPRNVSRYERRNSKLNHDTSSSNSVVSVICRVTCCNASVSSFVSRSIVCNTSRVVPNVAICSGFILRTRSFNMRL